MHSPAHNREGSASGGNRLRQQCPSPAGSSLSLWEVEPARAVPMQSELRGSSGLHLDYAKEARRGNKYRRWTQEFPGAKASAGPEGNKALGAVPDNRLWEFSALVKQESAHLMWGARVRGCPQLHDQKGIVCMTPLICLS